jgi:glycine betaine/proline transport system permease protein
MSVEARETKPAGSLEVAEGLGPTPPGYRPPSNPWPRRALWLGGVVVAVVVGLHLTGGFPAKWVVNLAAKFDNIELWVIKNQKKSPLFVDLLNPLQSGSQSSINAVVTMFNRMTFTGVLVTAAVIAGVAAGWRMAVLAAIGFFGLGLFGLWSESLETLALMLVSVAVALVIGIPLGVLSGRHPKVDRVLRPTLDAMQTVPAFSYLTFLVLFFGIGSPTALIATVIFALPPAVRLTSLGLRGVPLTSLEVADSFGSTKRQRLWKVHLPLSKPSIMLGVNQTIMMAMGLIVIAALVGAGGLGQTILDALQFLDIGKALNGGLTIVIMAIVLDRVSYAWGKRGRRASHVKFGRFSIPRWQVMVAAVAAALIGVVIGRYVLVQQDFPASWTISVAKPTNAFADWVTQNMSGATGWVSDSITKYGLDPLRSLFQDVPWWLVVAGVALFAWRVSRRFGLLIMCVVCLSAIGFLGLWADAMDTLSQVLVAVVLSIALAIPIGIWASQSDRVERVVKPILDAMQTMPAFVYLVPVVALFHVGRVPGVIASVIYALPPGIRLTNLGIREVPRNTIEAAESFGATRWQMLRKVQLPLARPSILLGANQTIMMVLSVVIIASLIGAAGLGLDVLNGLYHETGLAVVAGLAILMLAIVIDRVTQAMGMSPRSLRGPVGTGGWWTRSRALQLGRAKSASQDVTEEVTPEPTQPEGTTDTTATDEPGKGDE